MKHRRIIERFQEWHDDLVDENTRREIRGHLDECSDCKRYFEKMTLLLEGLDPARIPHLEPDPFLPSRIRATADGTAARATVPSRPLLGKLGLSLLSIAIAVALGAGVLLGSGLSARAASRAQDAALVAAYLDAFSPAELEYDWETVVVDEEENGS